MKITKDMISKQAKEFMKTFIVLFVSELIFRLIKKLYSSIVN